MIAPGAEEFVPQAYGSLALPPQRTFAPLVPGAAFGRERTRHVGVALERDVASFLRRRARTSASTSTTSWSRCSGSSGRTARAAPTSATTRWPTAATSSPSGWGVSISRPVGSRIRGSVEYSVADADLDLRRRRRRAGSLGAVGDSPDRASGCTT